MFAITSRAAGTRAETGNGSAHPEVEFDRQGEAWVSAAEHSVEKPGGDREMVSLLRANPHWVIKGFSEQSASVYPGECMIAMAQATSDRAWIASELVKGIDTERSLAAGAEARADSPPDAALSVLYHEIAAADERHATIIETIATRYGHTPVPSAVGGIGRAFGQFKDKLVELGSDALDQLRQDLTAKDQSVHWHAAWVHAFGALGDTESVEDLSAVLLEEQAHRDALQQGLNRVVEQHARGADASKAAPKASAAAR